VSTQPSIVGAFLYVRMEMGPVSEILCSVSIFLNYVFMDEFQNLPGSL